MISLSTEQLEAYNQMKSFYEMGYIFQYLDEEKNIGRKVKLKNKELLNFASGAYMGLEINQKMIQGAVNATKLYGTYIPHPRAVVSSSLYKSAEELLAKIFPGNTLITPTVSLGHFSVLPIVVGAQDAIILDSYIHNSVKMAAQWNKANGSFVIVSRHNDLEYVRYLTKRLKKEGYKKIWYCSDGIYSMHGDGVDIKQLHQLLNEEEDLYAYIDDAHGAGWCGKNGCGYALKDHGLHPKSIVAVSLSKSFSGCGAALIIPDKELADLIKMTGQTMVFSGPLQPGPLGGLVESLKIHLSDEIDILQKELHDLIEHYNKRVKELDLPLYSKGISPIRLLPLGDAEMTFKLIDRLFEKGCFLFPAVYPAVSNEDSGLRVLITRHLKREDIDYLLENTQQILRKELNFNKNYSDGK